MNAHINKLEEETRNLKIQRDNKRLEIKVTAIYESKDIINKIDMTNILKMDNIETLIF